MEKVRWARVLDMCRYCIYSILEYIVSDNINVDFGEKTYGGPRPPPQRTLCTLSLMLTIDPLTNTSTNMTNNMCVYCCHKQPKVGNVHDCLRNMKQLLASIENDV